MRNFVLITLLLLIMLSFSAPADLLNIPIKKMYAEPSINSKVVYEFPLNLTLLDVSDDMDWFKIRLKFDFLFVHYDYTGWVNIPSSKISVLKEYKPDSK